MSEDKDIVYDLDTLFKQFLISERPIHIEVTKNTKGYNYSVSYHGKEPSECIDVCIKVMDILKEKFEV